MSLIIGFFDGNNLRAASLEGLLVQNKDTQYWQLKDGKTLMPFSQTMSLLKDKYVMVKIHCSSVLHIALGYTRSSILYDCPTETRGKIILYEYGSMVHTVAFDGYFFSKEKCNWGLKDPKDSPMPLGMAFKYTEYRLIEMRVESIYDSMPSILNCKKRVLYP